MTDTAAATPDEDAAGQILRFDSGLPGFPDHRRFLLVDLVEDGAFQLLQSVDDPNMAMVVTVPWLFFPDYAPELDETAQRELGIDRPEDAVVFCPVTLDVEEEMAYVNLLGPCILNARTREGRQVVLADADQPTRAPVRLGG